MKTKSVHIYIPTFNRKELVIKTIDSVIKQNYKSWKLTIVDNCSTDGTFEEIKKIYDGLISSKKISIYKNKRTIKQGLNWNRLFDFLKKDDEYFMLLCSDDLLDPSFLSHGIEKLKNSNNNICGFCSAIQYIDLNGRCLHQRKYGFFGIEAILSIILRNYIGIPSSCILKTNDFIDYRFSNGNIFFCGDIFFFIQPYLRFKKKLIYSSKALVSFRKSLDSESTLFALSERRIFGRYKLRVLVLKQVNFKPIFQLFFSKLIKLILYFELFLLRCYKVIK